MHKRYIFYISDGTGITAETLGHSLITQFQSIEFDSVTIPYVNNIEKANEAVARINQTYHDTGFKPIIFATLINITIRDLIAKSHGVLFEFFNVFLEPLARELKCDFSYTVGKSHSLFDRKSYNNRIEAINFALACDDGLNTDKYDNAEIIILGASRTGKTPTCIYLALQFGIKAANYPLVEEDLMAEQLPSFFLAQKSKLFGLTIDANRLHAIRTERRANSPYASLIKCKNEIKLIQTLYDRFQIPNLDTTSLSIEEISTKVLEMKRIQRHLI